MTMAWLGNTIRYFLFLLQGIDGGQSTSSVTGSSMSEDEGSMDSTWRAGLGIVISLKPQAGVTAFSSEPSVSRALFFQK